MARFKVRVVREVYFTYNHIYKVEYSNTWFSIWRPVKTHQILPGNYGLVARTYREKEDAIRFAKTLKSIKDIRDIHKSSRTTLNYWLQKRKARMKKGYKKDITIIR